MNSRREEEEWEGRRGKERERIGTEYLKNKEKASSKKKKGNLCTTLYFKVTLKTIQQEMCYRKYVNRDEQGIKYYLVL
jgi:hypothetical protein